MLSAPKMQTTNAAEPVSVSAYSRQYKNSNTVWLCPHYHYTYLEMPHKLDDIKSNEVEKSYFSCRSCKGYLGTSASTMIALPSPWLDLSYLQQTKSPKTSHMLISTLNLFPVVEYGYHLDRSESARSIMKRYINTARLSQLLAHSSLPLCNHTRLKDINVERLWMNEHVLISCNHSDRSLEVDQVCNKRSEWICSCQLGSRCKSMRNHLWFHPPCLVRPSNCSSASHKGMAAEGQIPPCDTSVGIAIRDEVEQNGHYCNANADGEIEKETRRISLHVLIARNLGVLERRKPEWKWHGQVHSDAEAELMKTEFEDWKVIVQELGATWMSNQLTREEWDADVSSAESTDERSLTIYGGFCLRRVCKFLGKIKS